MTIYTKCGHFSEDSSRQYQVLHIERTDGQLDQETNNANWAYDILRVKRKHGSTTEQTLVGLIRLTYIF